MNTRLIFALFYSGTIFLFSCAGNDSTIEKEKLELEKEKLKLEQEKLELEKEKGEAYGIKDGAGMDKPRKPNNQGNQAKVTGQNVNIRSSHSVESKAIGMLGYGETVTVIGQHIPEGNYSEAILKEKTQFYDETFSNYVFTLTKGKAVIVEGAVDRMYYNISFIDDKTKRKSYARISADNLEFIGGEIWKNIVNSKGQSGWVLGRYIQSF
jgi:exonuclease III